MVVVLFIHIWVTLSDICYEIRIWKTTLMPVVYWDGVCLVLPGSEQGATECWGSFSEVTAASLLNQSSASGWMGGKSLESVEACKWNRKIAVFILISI